MRSLVRVLPSALLGLVACGRVGEAGGPTGGGGTDAAGGVVALTLHSTGGRIPFVQAVRLTAADGLDVGGDISSLGGRDFAIRAGLVTLTLGPPPAHCVTWRADVGGIPGPEGVAWVESLEVAAGQTTRLAFRTDCVPLATGLAVPALVASTETAPGVHTCSLVATVRPTGLPGALAFLVADRVRIRRVGAPDEVLERAGEASTRAWRTGYFKVGEPRSDQGWTINTPGPVELTRYLLYRFDFDDTPRMDSVQARCTPPLGP